MFKLRHIASGKIYTVYEVKTTNAQTYITIWRDGKWVVDNISAYEPIEESAKHDDAVNALCYAVQAMEVQK